MISFANVNKQYGKQVLFVDASFQLNPGEKVGLVGPNGAGKTTIFRMIVGEETSDDGEVSVPRKLTIVREVMVLVVSGRTACKRAPQKLEVVGVVASGHRYGRGFHDACLPGDEIEDGVDVNRWKPLVQAFGNPTILGEDVNGSNQFEPGVGPRCQDPRREPGEKDP